jgi:chemotaxis regulatin CheY-phosphate phosphatase CheZ
VEARGEVTEQETIFDPVSSLRKKHLVLKVGKLTKQNKKLKQEVTEYQVLDRHIKGENAQLKEYNRRLQYAQEEASAKINKVLCLIQYTRVIKKELRSEASGFNILQPDK